MSLRRNIGNVQQVIPQSGADKILSAVSQPMELGPLSVTPPISVTQVFADPGTPVISNTTPVAAIAPDSTNNTLLMVGAGAAAIWLLTRKNKSLTGTKNKKGSALPLVLIGGGVLAYYLYTQSQSPVLTTTTTNVNGNTVITPVVSAPAATANPAVVLPSDTTVYNQLYAYSVPWRYAVDRMSIAERQALYEYIFGYLKNGLRLYSYAGNFPDGYYDAALYSQIKALSSKWNLGLLN